ncbi:MAG TPA: VWA domain-containing protein [Solirubrobacteraceae bacterium]|jgi:Ca-activated chloride channel family protein
MSFISPLALLCLAVVPLALLAHVAAQRRRHRYPVRYTAISTLAAIAGEEPPWRRHLPFGLFLLALTLLALSLARPQHTVGVPIERASVVLVTDVSRSMEATDVDPSRLQAARAAAQTFLDKVPSKLRVGLVSFSDSAQTLQTPTTDHGLVSAALKQLQPIAGTSTGAGLATAMDDLKLGLDNSVRRPPSAIILLSDGSATDGTAAYDVATEAGHQHVPIYTVALGTPNGSITATGPDGIPQTLPVPPDPQALGRIASLSGGASFKAQDSDQLGGIYEKLGSQIGTKPEQRQITVDFAGAGLLALAAAMLAALGINGRLP